MQATGVMEQLLSDSQHNPSFCLAVEKKNCGNWSNWPNFQNLYLKTSLKKTLHFTDIFCELNVK